MLKSVPADFSKLSNVVKMRLLQKNLHNKLVSKVNNIDTSGFVLIAKYDADKTELENKIPDVSYLVKELNFSAKVMK